MADGVPLEGLALSAHMVAGPNRKGLGWLLTWVPSSRGHWRMGTGEELG